MRYFLTERRDADITVSPTFDRAIRRVEEGMFRRLDFLKLTSFYRERPECFASGEFWGKNMRGAVLCWQYTKSEWLKKKILESVDDMLACRDENGCMSCVPVEKQPGGKNGADLWERKYTLLGLIAAYQAFGGQYILDAAVREADVTIDQVGAPPKKPITEIGYAFYGIESSSIIDPIMKLYTITGYQRYLDFARYIVEEAGGCARGNIFEAVEAGADPMEVGSNGNPKESIAKSYEMMSCFEGLTQYAVATGSERWKRVVIAFWERIRAQEITLLGSGGADQPFNLGLGIGEQWNYAATEQSNPTIDLTMETCVTVTWMKFCGEIHRLTGRADVYDEIERAAYNALLGALRPDGMTFDYFQRFNGTRNNKVNFSYDFAGFPLTCCSANGPAGLCRVPYFGFSRREKGIYVSALAPAHYEDESFALRVEGDYPNRGRVRVTLEKVPEGRTTLALRVPAWAENAAASCGGEAVEAIPGQYLALTRTWKAGEELTLDFDMTLTAVPSPRGSDRRGDNLLAFVKGPLVYSRDCRYDQGFDQPVKARPGEHPYTALTLVGVQSALRVEDMTLIDFASAGETWDEGSAYRTWLERK